MPLILEKISPSILSNAYKIQPGQWTPNPHKLQNHYSPHNVLALLSSAKVGVVAGRHGKANPSQTDMAGSARSATAKHAYRMFAPSWGAVARCPGSPGGAAADEFDESDVWGSFSPAGVDSSPVELARARSIPSSAWAGRKKPLDRAAGAEPGSLPVNIPDWQKILGVEYRDHHAGKWELDGDDDDCGKVAGGGGAAVIPPHELAWRSRAASLSVHEGIGRTLKGRDLSRVRDAVWKQTGYED